ncbi:hypothetical protein CYMTET_32932 [Cymbomonas tetramitiformis]|uniref:Uncharacterized protein n=1 Tax=Cymbomonas tetramitiformis TaxID=36881 RepID=A0AAE0KRG1_9CHLO|nr:hypothetical protein CYMTET_32932 [Cymbomonas tetramitiformis]
MFKPLEKSVTSFSWLICVAEGGLLGLLTQTEDAKEILERKGVTQESGRLAYQVEQGAGHIESAWGGRLYGSLQFLCRHWFEEMNK